MAFAGQASAATYTPTTLADNEPGDPVDASDCNPGSTDACTLREALRAANDTPANDEILLSEGRYGLDDSEPLLSFGSYASAGSLVVRGTGARLSTIVGVGTATQHRQVMQFNGGAVVELRDLGVTGGYWGASGGGAIRILDSDGSDAEVTLTRVWVFDNHNSDSAGGAIENRGKLTIVQSLLSGNTSGGNGGAIANSDELKLINSTVSGNTADDTELEPDGGGIYNDGNRAEFGGSAPLGPTSIAGDIPVNAPYLLVENSTIAGNKAPHGNGGGVATELESPQCGSSIAGNCQGPKAYALFHNSIVSDNTAVADQNCFGNFPAGDPAFGSSEGYNLEDGDSCQFTATGDKLAVSGIGPLADNGGGTDTRKLLDGSVAIDGGDPANCEAIDQRGVTRPQRRTCDIGAFEREPDPARPVQQQPQPQPQAQAQAQAELPQPITPQGDVCRDRKPPVTVLRNPGLTVGGDSVKLKGTSRDLGAPCRSGVQRVEVSMAKVSGTDLNCRFLRRSNRFVITPFRNCRQPVLFKAEGTTEWSFTFRGVLSPGMYRAQARAYDAARNKETPKKRRNIVYFEVQ